MSIKTRLLSVTFSKILKTVFFFHLIPQIQITTNKDRATVFNTKLLPDKNYGTQFVKSGFKNLRRL